MQTITTKFPPLPLDELITRIKRFETASLEKKYELLTDLIGVHPTIGVDFSKGSVFKRARMINEEDYPELVQDLLWRVEGVARTGRANPEGFPVLYIADRQDTAFGEIHIDGHFVLLTELQIREGTKCRIVPIGEFLRIQRTGRGTLTGDLSFAINNMLNSCRREDAQSLLITDAFLFECMIKDDDQYQISSFVAKSIFEKDRKNSAIAYPSAKQYGAVNLAVRADDFWKSWAIIGARRMYVRHLALGYYESSRTEHVMGVTRLGKLIWGKGIIDNSSSHRLEPPWYPE